MQDFNQYIYDRIPDKKEWRLHSRGRLDVSDVRLLLKDLSRKQLFFNHYALPGQPDNPFIGLIVADMKSRRNTAHLAQILRNYLNVDLNTLRSKSKEKVVVYLTEQLELHNILVSFSSHNYMPQKLKGVEMSGICLKDKKFPVIFINTKDGEENPRIIEPAGRQIFTLVAMLVSLSMNHFVFSNKTKESKAPYLKVVYATVGEFLIPRTDIINEAVNTLDELKQLADRFKVTPSMCLYRLVELGVVEKPLSESLKQQLKDEVRRITGHARQPLQVNGYARYNGQRFSIEVLRAEQAGRISPEQTRNVLFRKGKKMDPNLKRDYQAKFPL
jgi:Zn-dependent peptidase ImmA (M78 family)